MEHYEKTKLKIIGREERQDIQLKDPGNILQKIIENFPNLNKEMLINVQEAYTRPNRLAQKENTPNT